MTRHDGPVGRSWLALRWAVGGAATVLLASCLGLALLAQLGLTALGTAAWKRGDPLAAEQAFSRGLAVNLVDRWVLPFDRGVARFSQRSWSGAAEDFELAATAERLAAKTGDGRQETEAVEADPASRLQELEALERLAREADQAGRDESGAAAEPPSDGTRSW